MPHAPHDTAPEMRTLTIDLTVYYTLLLPRGAHDSPPALLLALHGWGQTAKRFITDFDRLRDRNILVVAPQGPHQFYLDLSTRKIGFNWLTAYDKERAIADINGYLARLLAVLNEEHPYDASRIFLLGFSQGVPMAYRFAISGHSKPAGVIACCGDLAKDVAEALPSVPAFPVLLAHASGDRLVPEETLREAEAILDRHAFPRETFIFSGGHRITAELVAKVEGWILNRDPRRM